MKKYLMRGGESPLDIFTPEQIIEKNLIGANSGNLLYAFGVYRTLMTEDVVIDVDYYGVERFFTEKDIDRINEEYDAYICPLADAFREAFSEKLVKYAKLFDKLKIPCYVIGLDVRAPYESSVKDGFSFDEQAKVFVNSVLKKSSLLGLRGEITAEYMKHLGFQEDRDFQVIGCPSMYTFGRELPQRKLQFSSDDKLISSTRISCNMSSITPENVLGFLFAQMNRFPNHFCIEQNEAELRLLYNGIRYITNQKDNSTLLPLEITHPLLKEDRYKFFINVKTWFEFFETIDLCIGSKLHGNVAGILSGCPTLFIPIDGRMRELVSYHNFPSIPYNCIEETDKLEDVLENVDLQSHLKRQGENFDRFIAFLDKNGLNHIYKEDKTIKNAPVDKLMKEKEYPVVESILSCSRDEAVRRFNVYNERNRRTISSLKKENKALKQAIPGSLKGILKKYLKKKLKNISH